MMPDMLAVGWGGGGVGGVINMQLESNQERNNNDILIVNSNKL